MLASGLLDRQRVGDVDAVIESGAYRQFYMHGTGHWLGRDVHDVGEYASLGEAPVDQLDGLGGRVVKKPSRVLQAGMVVTLEPGLYVRPAVGVPERFWDIGIRIEDDAVVTASRLRTDQPRRAGGGRRDRGADARMTGGGTSRCQAPHQTPTTLARSAGAMARTMSSANAWCSA